MSEWKNGIVTPADRAEQTARNQTDHLNKMVGELQGQTDILARSAEDAKKEARFSKKVAVVALAVSVATLIFTFLSWLFVILQPR